MKWTAVSLTVAALTLTACGQQAEDRDAEARELAARTAARILFAEYPTGFPVSPLGQCIGDLAAETEVAELLIAEKNGVTGRTTQMVLAIAQRPEVKDCAKDAGVTVDF